MSYILALDTASDYCSVAIVDVKQAQNPASLDITELRRQAPRQHTQLLLPMVDELLQQLAINKSELSAIAFGAGPGSFTGLRICFAVVQGLAYGLNIPVIPVSTLAAMASAAVQQPMAQSAQPSSEPKLVLSCLDARMNQVYWGAYQWQEGLLAPLLDDQLDDPDNAARKMQEIIAQQSAQAPLYCVGPGWVYEDLQSIAGSAQQQDLKVEPWAMEILRLASVQWQDSKAQDIRSVQPVYLRNEVSWEKRQRIRQTP